MMGVKPDTPNEGNNQSMMTILEHDPGTVSRGAKGLMRDKGEKR